MIKELNKNEAIYFVNITTEFINVDKNVNVEEKEVLEKYLKKLNITEEEVRSINAEEALRKLQASNDRIKNIIYFELLGLALIDGEYETNEIDYLEKIADSFNISRAKKIAYANFYFDYENIKKLSSEEKNERVNSIL